MINRSFMIERPVFCSRGEVTDYTGVDDRIDKSVGHRPIERNTF